MEVIENKGTKNRTAELWKIVTVFILSAIGSAYGEMILWKDEILIAIGVIVLVYFLGSLRLVPWKTSLRKAFSTGVFFGLFITIIFWKFGISI